MELIIEEISRGNKLLQRHKYQQAHISIGRGYKNDIILSDPHICPEHLSIEYTGENWVIKNKSSVNGSFLELGKSKNKKVLTEHRIKSGDIITLGKSQIRFLFSDHPVPETIVYSSFETLINFLRHPSIIAFNILIFCAISAWVFHLNQLQTTHFSQLLVPTIGAAVIFTLWPLAIALISFLTKHEARALNQLGVSFLFFNLLYINDFIDKLLAFNFPINTLINNVTIILTIALTFALLWLNCHIGFHMSTKRRVFIVSCLTFLFFGGSALFDMSKQPDFDPEPHYNATIMTPMFKFNQGVSVSQFADDTRTLFRKTAKAAQKKAP